MYNAENHHASSRTKQKRNKSFAPISTPKNTPRKHPLTTTPQKRQPRKIV